MSNFCTEECNNYFSSALSIRDISERLGVARSEVQVEANNWATRKSLDSYSSYCYAVRQARREEFGRAIRYSMIAKDLRRRETAELLRIDHCSMTQYFEGNRMPGDELFGKIVTVLGINHLMEGGSND